MMRRCRGWTPGRRPWEVEAKSARRRTPLAGAHRSARPQGRRVERWGRLGCFGDLASDLEADASISSPLLSLHLIRVGLAFLPPDLCRVGSLRAREPSNRGNQAKALAGLVQPDDGDAYRCRGPSWRRRGGLLQPAVSWVKTLGLLGGQWWCFCVASFLQLLPWDKVLRVFGE